MNRRQFVTAAAATCAACIFCNAGPAGAAAKIEPVDVGPLTDFAKDGIYDKFAEKHQFFVVRAGGRLYATHAVCTHKGFSLVVNEGDKGQFRCTKHGSLFALNGEVAKGPARKPLIRHAIRLNDRNRVVVDASRQFEEKDWGKEEAFVNVKA